MKRIAALAVLCALTLILGGCDLLDGLLVPGKVNSMLSEEQRENFIDAGLVLQEGTNPPNIEGVYEAMDFDCTYDTTNYFLQNLTYAYEFYNKKGLDIQVRYTNFGVDSGEGKGAYVLGSGNDFTVYQEIKGSTKGSSGRS